jgi:hypothetical protein
MVSGPEPKFEIKINGMPSTYQSLVDSYLCIVSIRIKIVKDVVLFVTILFYKASCLCLSAKKRMNEHRPTEILISVAFI